MSTYERQERIDNRTAATVVRTGSFYFPAWKHYGRQTPVRCDRCFSEDIAASVGAPPDYDMCMKCVAEVAGLLRDFDADYAPPAFTPPGSSWTEMPPHAPPPKQRPPPTMGIISPLSFAAPNLSGMQTDPETGLIAK